MSAPSTLTTLGDTSGNVLIVDDFSQTRSRSTRRCSARTVTRSARRRAGAGGPAQGRRARTGARAAPDVSMPGLDGVEVLKRLRVRRGGGPSVIMLTAARREPHAIEAGLKEGADAYLTKPIDSRELVARARAALETFRLKRVLDAQRRDHVAMLVHDLRHHALVASRPHRRGPRRSEDLTAEPNARRR